MTKNIHDMMIQKPSLKYRDVREYEGKYYDWAEGEHLLEKGMLVDEIFHPLEHDIRFIKDEQVTLRDGVKILTDVYLPARTHDAFARYGGVAKYSGAYGRLRVSRRHLDEKLSTDIIPVQSFDRDEKLSKGEIAEIEVSLAPMGMTFYPGETLRLLVTSQNITGNVHAGVTAFASPENRGKHIIHCGGEYQSYLQIGVLK